MMGGDPVGAYAWVKLDLKKCKTIEEVNEKCSRFDKYMKKIDFQNPDTRNYYNSMTSRYNKERLTNTHFYNSFYKTEHEKLLSELAMIRDDDNDFSEFGWV